MSRLFRPNQCPYCAYYRPPKHDDFFADMEEYRGKCTKNCLSGDELFTSDGEPRLCRDFRPKEAELEEKQLAPLVNSNCSSNDSPSASYSQSLSALNQALAQLDVRDEAVFEAQATWDSKSRAVRVTIPSHIAKRLRLQPKDSLLIYVKVLERRSQ